jgi:hypothetical protein
VLNTTGTRGVTTDKGGSTSSVGDEDVTYQALLLALVASQLRTAWHAGVIDADKAMKSLDNVISEICQHRAVKEASGHPGRHQGGPFTEWEQKGLGR